MTHLGSSHPYGIRVAGAPDGRRRRVIAKKAFDAHCRCASNLDGSEAYLSVFQLGDDFKDYHRRFGSVRGFEGSTWAEFLVIDIDRYPHRGGAGRALEDVCLIVVALEEYFGVNRTLIIPFFSGSKGFHLLVPTSLWRPSPSIDYPEVTRQAVRLIAAEAKVEVDLSIYQQVHLLRAPNTRHPETGLFKRYIPPETIDSVTPGQVLELACEPFAFRPYDATGEPICNRLVDLWAEATSKTEKVRERLARRKEDIRTGNHPVDVWPVTRRFLQNVIPVGERNNSLFRAALNFAELGMDLRAIYSLLTHNALCLGLREREIERTIRSAYCHVYDNNE